MPTTVINRPGPVNFTDNPSRYVLGASFTNANQKMEVRVFAGSPYTPVAILFYPNYAGGLVIVSINKLLRSYIFFKRPDITGTNYSAIQWANHSIKAWLEFRLFDPALAVQPAFVSDSANQQRYIKGGYGLWSNQPNFNFEDKRKWFFTWQKSDKLVGEDEPNWLLYCHPEGVPADVEYTLYYTDGTHIIIRNAFVQTDNIPAERQYDQWFIPVGVKQCALETANPLKQIHKYRIRILKRSDSKVLAEFSFRIDYRPNYDAMVIYYRNSLGGWDSQRLLGTIEETNSYERKDFQMDVFGSSYTFASGSAGANPLYQVKETRKWKANTGHIGKEEIDAVRDMFLSKEMAMIRNNTWIPLKITSDTLNGLNTNEPLQNIPFEFEAAFDNDNYTPDKLPWTQ